MLISVEISSELHCKSEWVQLRSIQLLRYITSLLEEPLNAKRASDSISVVIKGITGPSLID